MNDVPALNPGDLLLYKDNQLIAFNKPPSIAVQSVNSMDFHKMAMAYAKRNLYILHRLDQPTSGVVLFARNPKAAAIISKQIKDRKIERTYFAIVNKKPPEQAGELRNYLVKSKRSNKSYVVDSKQKGALEAIMEYQLLGHSDRYHLLKIQLKTGRHHQIRAQLANVGCHIKGDVKYGSRRSNPDRSIHLHASNLLFNHPVSDDQVSITAEPPEDTLWQYFSALMKTLPA